MGETLPTPNRCAIRRFNFELRLCILLQTSTYKALQLRATKLIVSDRFGRGSGLRLWVSYPDH